jgi:nucleoside-diphosphate-sugar epimerase
LFDRESVRRTVGGHQAVLNLATHVPRPGLGALLPGAWSETARIREQASALIADAALSTDVELLVQESFAPIYEDAGDHWIGEGAIVRPARYNRSTLTAEAAARRFTDGGGRGIVLRFAFFYGPDDDFTRTIVTMGRRGWLPIPGRPEGYFSTVGHADAASAVLDVLEAPAGIYNVVDNEPLTRRQLGELVADLLRVGLPKSPPRWVAPLAGGLGETMARSLRISNAKLRDMTSWTPQYPNARAAWRAALDAAAQR